VERQSGRNDVTGVDDMTERAIARPRSGTARPGQTIVIAAGMRRSAQLHQPAAHRPDRREPMATIQQLRGFGTLDSRGNHRRAMCCAWHGGGAPGDVAAGFMRR
jgi:hypothetical protein